MPDTDPVAEAWQELYSLLETNHVGNTLIERDSGHMTLGDAVIAVAGRLAAAKALAAMDELWAQVARLPAPADRREWLKQRWNLQREVLEKEAVGGR